MSGSPFGRRATRWLVGVCIASFLVSLFWSVFGPELVPERSAGSDSFSRSALGHSALLALLSELDVPVVASRHDSGARAGESATLLVLEPGASDPDRPSQSVRGLVRRADRAIVVLPKWAGEADELHPERLSSVWPVARHEVSSLLDELGIDAHVVRLGDSLRGLRFRGLTAQPQLRFPQLLDTDDLEPVAECEEGVLLGRARVAGRNVLVLSDPDVISNHGLVRPGNAEFAMEMLALVRDDGEPVIVDETLHGFALEPSVYRSLFRFPLVLATLQAVVALLVLLWAAVGRFGAPLPARPPIEPGKGFLISNIAGLLATGRHARYALERYLRATAAEVARALHAPVGLDAAGLRDWLDRHAEARGLTQRLTDLERLAGRSLGRGEATERRALALARRTHDWKEEMIHGRRRDA